MDGRFSRRVLLGAGALLPLAGCTRESAPPPPDPDDALRAAAVEREQTLLREYDAVLLVLPDLSARLTPLRAEHAEHLLALTREPTTGPSPSASPLPQVPPPATAAAALAGLAAAERAAATGHRDAALEASRELAGLLAALSASEASHPVVLG